MCYNYYGDSMNILDIAILIFMGMELSNVIILYFFPDSTLGNGVAIFNNYHLAKKDENSNLFTKYMVNWVAGTKLIFIFLLGAILIVGNDEMKIGAVIAMIFSIATYFFRLHPIITKLDKNKMITPFGYSKILLLMIVSFIVLFSGSLIIYLNIN